MNKVTFDFRTGSLNDFGYNTSINLHERNELKISRSLHDKISRSGVLKAKNDDWELFLFIENADTAREMADKLTEIANFIEDTDV